MTNFDPFLSLDCARVEGVVASVKTKVRCYPPALTGPPATEKAKGPAEFEPLAFLREEPKVRPIAKHPAAYRRAGMPSASLGRALPRF